MNITEVESAITALSAAHPALCELISLPNPTHEGRSSHAIRVSKGALDSRPAVLFIGGQHAREWGSCEILVNLAADLIEAYTTNAGLAYGGTTFTAAQVKHVMEDLQVFLFPLVNPDGRGFSQSSSTNSMWRKNRNPAAGVDLNRNYDFLWDFQTALAPGAGAQVSNLPSSDVYRGTAPFSEPETRNVRWLLDTYPQIGWFIDVHSFSQLLYHTWGDDENQAASPSQNFLNPAHDGARGLSGDAYGEYIPAGDLIHQRALAERMRSALQGVRGISYTTGQSFELYPTTGTATDYPYSRHFADPTKTKTHGFLIEWGVTFQPAWSEMEKIILDVDAALLAFILAAPDTCATLDLTLNTPSVAFNDVPEGEPTARAVVFQVTTCATATFQIVSGPTVASGPGSFGALPSPNAAVNAGGATVTDMARLWLSFTGQANGDITQGTVTVRLTETGQEWVIPISANTIARPTVAAVLVLDQSGSMLFPSGLPGFANRNEVLKFAAPVFANLLHEDNGIGIVAFDHDAYDRMAVQTVGLPGPIDPVRASALVQIGAHTPNPLGDTAIGDGVEKAHNLLAAASGYDHKAMIVFTDGHETADKYISAVGPLINERVFAIGLGTAAQIQPAALTALTGGTGGYLLLTGNLGPDDLFRLSKYYLQILAGVTNYDIVLDPEGALQPGGVARIPFHLNEADISVDAILLGQADLPVIRFLLETPSGDLIDPGAAGTIPGASHTFANGTSFYRMTLPVPIGAGASSGQWTAVLQIEERYYKKYLSMLDNQPDLYQQVLAHGVRYSLSVQSYSGLRLQGQLLQSSNEPGATLTLRAVLTEYGLPVPGSRAALRAEFERPDGTGGLLILTEESPGAGIYSASMAAPLPGVYHFRLLAAGTTLRGRPFTREHLLTGAVWQGGDNPPPTGQPDPGGGRDELCRLIACLLDGQVITPEFEKRLREWGLNVDALRRCWKEYCA